MLEIEIIEVSVTQMGFALMLRPPGKEKIVPIFIGPLETYSISSALENQKLERPLTHDLMRETLAKMGCRISRVMVDDFKNGTFFAKLNIENTKGESIQIDSRPSDAIAMAVRFRAPILMSESVYDATAIDVNQVKEKINKLSDETEMGPTLDELSDALNTDFITEDDKKATDVLQNLINDFNSPPGEKRAKEAKGAKGAKGAKSRPAPKSDKEMSSKMEVLKQMLRTAIDRENYEEAAEIRDELIAIRSQKRSSKKRKKNTNTNTKNKKANKN